MAHSGRADGEPGDIARLLARDEDAWRALHEREFPVLYRFARGMGADEHLAEDCASEAFIRLLRELPKRRLDTERSIRAWLLVVCRNYLRDQFRRSHGAPTPLDAADVAMQAADIDPHTRLALEAALAPLPETQREVLVMRFMLGMTTQQVAHASGRGVKAVESLQHRAIEALRRSGVLRKEDR